MNITFTRQQYINRECTHREYYSQFVTDGVKQRVKSAFKMKDLIEGKNQHFNNLPLQWWDELIPVLPFEINRELQKRGDYATKAGVVCILKEAAMQIVEE